MQDEKEQPRPTKKMATKSTQKDIEEPFNGFRPVIPDRYYPPECYRGTVIRESAPRPPIKSHPIVKPQLSKQETCDRIQTLLLKKFYGDHTLGSVLPENTLYYFPQLSTLDLDSQFPKVTNSRTEEYISKLEADYEAAKYSNGNSTPDKKELQQVKGYKVGYVSKQDETFPTPEIKLSSTNSSSTESIEKKLEQLCGKIDLTTKASRSVIPDAAEKPKKRIEDYQIVLPGEIPSTSTYKPPSLETKSTSPIYELISDDTSSSTISSDTERFLVEIATPSPTGSDWMEINQALIAESYYEATKERELAITPNVSKRKQNFSIKCPQSESMPKRQLPKESPRDSTTPEPRPKWCMPMLKKSASNATPAEPRPKWYLPKLKKGPRTPPGTPPGTPSKYSINSELTSADIESCQTNEIICCPFFNCNDIFQDIEDFVTHLYAHGNIKICMKCWKVFPDDKMLMSHSITHMTDKLIPCQFEYCAKHYKEVSDLKKHMQVHFTSKPYVCPKCDLTFGEKEEIARHVAGHTAKILVL